jgi:hypothetical protein
MRPAQPALRARGVRAACARRARGVRAACARCARGVGGGWMPSRLAKLVTNWSGIEKPWSPNRA